MDTDLNAMTGKRVVCSKQPDAYRHDKFITTVIKKHYWKTDAGGRLVEDINYAELVEGPKPGSNWTCAHCGADGRVIPDTSSIPYGPEHRSETDEHQLP